MVLNKHPTMMSLATLEIFFFNLTSSLPVNGEEPNREREREREIHNYNVNMKFFVVINLYYVTKN